GQGTHWTRPPIIDNVFFATSLFLRVRGRIRDMKTLLRLLAATAALVIVSGPAVPITAPVGKVLSAAQTVRASGNAGARVLTKNAEIFFLDRISTNATGIGEFEFSDGTKLAVG